MRLGREGEEGDEEEEEKEEVEEEEAEVCAADCDACCLRRLKGEGLSLEELSAGRLCSPGDCCGASATMSSTPPAEAALIREEVWRSSCALAAGDAVVLELGDSGLAGKRNLANGEESLVVTDAEGLEAGERLATCVEEGEDDPESVKYFDAFGDTPAAASVDDEEVCPEAGEPL